MKCFPPLLQVAIEQLQQELSASRKEEEVFKEEARKVLLLTSIRAVPRIWLPQTLAVRVASASNFASAACWLPSALLPHSACITERLLRMQ